MIKMMIKLLCVIVFVFVGIVCSVVVFDGLMEVLSVVGLIGSGVLFSWELYVLRMGEIDREIDEEYMSEEWLESKREGWENEVYDRESEYEMEVLRDRLEEGC